MVRANRVPFCKGYGILTPTGIPHGSPLSPILYLIYNADLVEGCEGVKTSGWVDDVAFIVTGKDEHEILGSNTEACLAAQASAYWHAFCSFEMVSCSSFPVTMKATSSTHPLVFTPSQPSTRHASVFDPKKYALIHFVNPGSREEGYTPLVLPSTTVQATTTAERYLEPRSACRLMPALASICCLWCRNVRPGSSQIPRYRSAVVVA
jgi:hypothetical protein